MGTLAQTTISHWRLFQLSKSNRGFRLCSARCFLQFHMRRAGRRCLSASYFLFVLWRGWILSDSQATLPTFLTSTATTAQSSVELCGLLPHPDHDAAIETLVRPVGSEPVDAAAAQTLAWKSPLDHKRMDEVYARLLIFSFCIKLARLVQYFLLHPDCGIIIIVTCSFI